MMSFNIRLRELVCAVWCFLAWFHIPIYTRDGDTIGVYDLFLLCLIPFWAAASISKIARINLRSPRTFPVMAYLLFLACVGFSIVLNLDRVIWPFGFLLYLKQFEYLFAVLISIWLFQNVEEHVTRRCIAWSALAMTLASVAVFLHEHDWNMRLPFTRSGSGAVLGATCFSTILFLLFGRAPREKAYWPVIGMLFICGLFSMGRTQVIAFVVAGISWGMTLAAKRGSRVWILAFAGIALGATYITLMTLNPFHINWYDNDPLRFLYAPQLLTQDESFRLRIESVWMQSLPAWTSSAGSILFGAGFGSQRYVDGLYFDLLFTTGIAGMLLYAAFHLAVFNCLKNYGYLVVFWLTTSITNELLLNSYRYIQIAALVIAWLWLHRNRYPVPVSRAALPRALSIERPPSQLVEGAPGNA